MNDSLTQQIARELGVRPAQVEAAARLFDEGNTIPFIARYRKEATGTLDEEQLRTVQARLEYLRNLEARKQTVLASIDEQGRLSPELRDAILNAPTLQQVEDLYLPYRPKRRTRATIAREKGLQPLADLILAQQSSDTPYDSAVAFLNNEVASVEEALVGARDIVAEQISETPAVRQRVRHMTAQGGRLVSRLAAQDADPHSKYRLYHDFAQPLSKIQPHQLLAINRGESEGALRITIEAPEDAIQKTIEKAVALDARSPWAGELAAAIADGYRRLLGPSIEREQRGEMTEGAGDNAIRTFQQNLRALLLQRPLKNKTVVGIDPGFRTGCKVAVCDATGKVLETATIYPHEPQNDRAGAERLLTTLVRRHAVEVIAIGNGTAGRETERLVAELIGKWGQDGVAVSYAVVNEAGASVYSASPLARQELPELDVAMRGAVSIARRLQDPLAELVKIDPQSIGVGLYQHDVDQKKLAAALDAVIESVVNSVGVNVNTASPALLARVAGLTRRTADAIAAHRDANGPFTARRELLRVRGLGPKAFEQAAGFLRIPGAADPLDATAIHPESYPVVQRLLARLELNAGDAGLALEVQKRMPQLDVEALARELEVGEPTLRDILEALARPGRDPRDDLPPPILRADVLSMEDLRPGMRLKGTVRNVVAFGAFVDIGVKQDGLVHVSRMSQRYVSNPHEVVAVGDVVEVTVMHVDKERGRIELSMKEG
ncbi:MAG TPA: Tex family protein [Ardenticatenaceae bacterium]|nr:Tex family protein [Ardenticatenaceae bacterium]